MFELKPLSREAIPRALEKAERYRLLNEPLEAESICRDILEVAPDHQEALVTLLLALSDQLVENANAFAEAKKLLERLREPYARSYYGGILCERRAKAALRRGGPGSGRVAYEWLREAMALFERAGAQRPAGDDDAILRWNTCASILMGQPGVARLHEDPFHPLLE